MTVVPADRRPTAVPWAMGLGVAAFLANDVLLPLAPLPWLLADWTLRAVIVAAFLVSAEVRGLLIRQVTAGPAEPVILWTIGCTGAALLAQWLAEAAGLGGGPFGYPALDRADLVIADGIIGIPLVAASEELVFRAAPMIVWGRRSALWWVIGSSLAFAAIHWGLGLRSMVPALATGLVFATALARTGSILPASIAHVLVNWVEFTLPQLMFTLR